MSDVFWKADEVSCDFHRYMYIFAHCKDRLFPFGYNLKQGAFWPVDFGNVKFYGMYIKTATGVEPYQLMIGGHKVLGFKSFIDAYRALNPMRNAIMFDHNHVTRFGHPCLGECDVLDCDTDE